VINSEDLYFARVNQLNPLHKSMITTQTKKL